MTLVVTSKAPDQAQALTSLGEVVRELAAEEEVAILCYADAVYNLVAGSKPQEHFAQLPGTFYAVEADVLARGIAQKLVPNVRQVDYPAVVDLILAAGRLVSCA